MKMLNRRSPLSQGSNTGFSLTEALVALTVTTITLGVTGPMFVAQNQMNIDSEVSSGAKSVATRCLEMIRQRDPRSLKVTTAFNATRPACNLSTAELTQMGKQYQVATWIRDAKIDPDNMTSGEFGTYTCNTSQAQTIGVNDSPFYNPLPANAPSTKCITVKVILPARGEVHRVSSVFTHTSDQ